MSGEDFSSLSALAQMAETAAPKDPARAKKAAGPDPRLLAGQVATFKSLVLESPQVARMIKKARRQGIYAVRPWQWGALALLLPLTTLAVAYAGWRASRETRSYLAMNQAVIAARRGDVRLADQEIRRSLSFGYSPVAGNHAVALALVESKRYDAALDFFDRARLASGYTAIEPQLDAVRVSLERLAPSDALERLQVASEVAGKYPEYFLLRARAHRLLGDYDRARADAGEALERNPNSIAARWILFEIGRARGDTDAVRENRSILLARTLRGDEPTEVQIGLARLYLTQDRRKPAREILDRVLPRATEEHYAEIYYTRGLLGIGERRFGEALADLDEAVRRAPRNPEFLARRAEILYGDGRIEEAIRDLQRATEADPLHARARYNLAWILWADARDPRAAHPHFEAARGQVQDLPHLAYALAATRYAVGDYEGSRAAFDMIPEPNREIREARFLRGILALRTARLDEATELFRGLVDGSKREPRILSNLGLALELQGDTLAAGRLYWAAMEASPSPRAPDPIAERNLQNVLQGREVVALDGRIHEEIVPRPASFLR